MRGPESTENDLPRDAHEAPSLDNLLERLAAGDAQAAEQAFLAFEPHLRMVVRRQLSPRLRAKFDSSDIVQSVWADVLRGLHRSSWHFKDSDQLRGFLVTATRHRFIDRARRVRRAVERESPLGLPPESDLPASGEPRASEEFLASELWGRLVALCPPAHLELLELRRRGVPLAEIAERIGLHESSVRRILYELSRRVSTERRPIGPGRGDSD
jgi:RNA polymerase sigma-70 factor (ECF subfamily)